MPRRACSPPRSTSRPAPRRDFAGRRAAAADEGSAAAELLELDLVREALELLLQLWQCTSMRDALVVGSWSDDLRSVCGHLVRGDVHPQLAELALPAKILQNALG